MLVTRCLDMEALTFVLLIVSRAGVEVMALNGKSRKKIRADALAAEATAIFHKFTIDELPVVDASNRPVGMIDVQDIVTIKVVG